jgi:ubiquitin-protein ligase
MSSSLVRRVRKEYQLLRELPPDIYARSFTDRLDLFWGIIFGPSDTLYAHAPFIFEFQLPVDYPKSPPLVYFRNATGGQPHPHLYEGGKGTVFAGFLFLFRPRKNHKVDVLGRTADSLVYVRPFYRCILS